MNDYTSHDLRRREQGMTSRGGPADLISSSCMMRWRALFSSDTPEILPAGLAVVADSEWGGDIGGLYGGIIANLITMPE